MSANGFKARWLSSIADISATHWNALAGDYPFLRHEFLHALESTGCASAASGWTPQHLSVYKGTELVAAAAMYEKSHSWGEFVFDFSWARAWQERGLPYYPKLILAPPFTPATGPRLLVHADYDATSLRQQLLQLIVEYAERRELSSAHALFVDDVSAQAAEKAGWLARHDCQFQWRQRGYRDFEDYLALFTADKRKKVRRERRRIAEQGIQFITLTGTELTAAQLRAAYAFHASTFARHGHQPYLTPACFAALAANMGDRMLFKLAMRDNSPVAAAVFFRSDHALYGRYWGAVSDFHSLHFEACYYQGIELCLELGLQRFEPGTQGEHKLARGFEPTVTRSAHWIADEDMRRVVAAYLQREQRSVAGYAAAAHEHLPFRAPAP